MVQIVLAASSAITSSGMVKSVHIIEPGCQGSRSVILKGQSQNIHQSRETRERWPLLTVETREKT
jgi:hypothetical protein